MKIAFVIDHLRADGTQHVLVQLTEGLTQRRHALTLFCLNHSFDDALVARLRAAGARVEIVGARALALGYGWAQLFWELRAFDVVVTLLFVSDVVGRTVAHFARVPRIVTSIRARNVNYSRLMLALSRVTMRWADAIILNSRGVQDFAVRAEGVAPDKLFIIPNGIRVQDYAVPLARVEFCREFGIASGKKIVGSVGRLTRQKGYDVLLNAIAQLDTMPVELVLIGEGEEHLALVQQATELGLQNVHWAGYRRDVPKLLGALDVYVQPSRFEGMPNALLEAMAAGCPIVATAVDGSRELIRDGMDGWLVSPEDAQALANAIHAALTSGTDAKSRAHTAQQRAQSMYGLEQMVAAWERVLTGNEKAGNSF